MIRLALTVALLANVARAAPPKACDASVDVIDLKETAHVVGAVKSITAVKDPVPHFAIVVADTKDFAFDLYIASAQIPFKVGDKLDATFRRGGGWHQVYDALIKNAAGKTLLVASGSGADDLADGWSVKTGKVVESRQDPNQKKQSINRTHALDFARGTTKLSVSPNTCAVVKDNGETYLVAGSGNSWLGVRPPEGIDYQTFSIVRQ